jgi:hypothetical protein
MGTAKPKGKPGDEKPSIDRQSGDETSSDSGGRIRPDEAANPLHQRISKSLQQLITDVRSQSRQPAPWRPFPDSEPILRTCDPVAQKLAAVRRSVSQIILDDRGDRV